MSETYTTKSGQKITTHYDTPAAKDEEPVKKHSDRAAQNRKIRDESKARPDARENLSKAEPENEPEQERKPRKKQVKQHKEPGPIENIGRNVSGYVAKNVGAPVWMNTGGSRGRAAPPAWITGSYGGGKLPAWVMGGPAPWEPPAKKAAPRRIRSVPKTPKSTRPAWMQW
jgi:hypothetical protein